MLKKINEASEFIKKYTDSPPKIGIILGTGLGGLVSEINIKHSIEYNKIPHFPTSTVEGHSGKLILGYLENIPVIVMQGRFHFYEGYSMHEITMPVRVMKMLGIERLIISNASGGINPDHNVGDLMIINDHINLIPNPLIGKNIDSLGPRFPDMSDPYCDTLIKLAERTSNKHNIKVHKGIYAAVTGPTLETPAEYMYLRNIGADAVGMSTVPEVIVARHMNIPCFAISVITDLGVPGKIKKITHEDVQDIAQKVEPKLTLIVKELISEL